MQLSRKTILPPKQSDMTRLSYLEPDPNHLGDRRTDFDDVARIFSHARRERANSA